MDQMQLSDSDFEVVSPVSNQSITQVSRNVDQNPLFARYQLKAGPISIKRERKYVNPHVNKFKVQQIQALVFDDIPSGYIQKTQCFLKKCWKYYYLRVKLRLLKY
ncbi:Hypothetical_protein [Hexamita inflata]|uniref:Hypothetical_protein n=1 Tax=Hexamita inflata TaxID=28002 RepID=A0AA86NQY0_9EUKA|nr:Hypothetical protein HINF_LOCUS11421 [Hexamita inflata]